MLEGIERTTAAWLYVEDTRHFSVIDEELPTPLPPHRYSLESLSAPYCDALGASTDN